MVRPREQQIVLVGEAPGPRSSGRGAFDGRSGDWLARLAGLGRGREELIEKLHCVNILDPDVMVDASGEPLPRKLGIPLARRLLPFLAGRAVIFAGLTAAKCFVGLTALPLFSWRRGRLETGDELVYAVIPNPSGLNRQWNGKDTLREGAEFMSRAVRVEASELLSGRSELLGVAAGRPIESPREGLWDYERAAEYLCVENERLRRWVFEHQIPHVRLSRYVVRFRRSDLDAFIQRLVVPVDYRGRRAARNRPHKLGAEL